LLLSNNASPHQFAFPLAGHDARKHRDEDVGYTLRHHSSQAENTLRVEDRACGKVCGKIPSLKTLNKTIKASEVAVQIVRKNERENQKFSFSFVRFCA